ncbi:carbonic anhydrase [Desulfosporosinus hippei]|uniref:Carbonic anhydrase n=1 Tax=Desulfosporosinus hippei DSM 8344 TaxID=1121419 RepID=A0A1G7YMZ3_9FIRM|nr:carbonic anhydrase [Desulfosporosinus hippei]SDG97754.1 carbonic anhydrase [Desulfosporosinus hippei DSM 8344]
MSKPSTYYLSCAILSLAILLSGCDRLFPAAEQQTNVSDSSPAREVLAAPVYMRSDIIATPEEAQKLLMEGNERFRTGQPLSKDLSLSKRSELMEKGQHPFAVIVCCSDSRVPPELLFDQALGDLFIIRIAGNIITPPELGSVEYAVEHLNTPLVVVLGHENCGAVTASVQGGEAHGNISSILNKIAPALEKAKSEGTSAENLISKTTEFNVENAKLDILQSPIIKERLAGNNVSVLGMMYDLDEGKVTIVN